MKKDYPSSYMHEEVRQELDEQSKLRVAGYIIIIDIINSTKRKIDYKESWLRETKAFYSMFKTFAHYIRDELGAKSEEAVIKFIGDCGMIFVKTSNASEAADSNNPEGYEYASPIQAQAVIGWVEDFLNKFRDASGMLSNMAVKCVVGFINDVQFVGDHHENSTSTTEIDNKDERNDLSGMPPDVIGRGVDFAFRLESFADIGHIVVNKYILPKEENERRDFAEECGFDVVPIVKSVKGWTNPETFYVFVAKQQIESSYRDKIPSPDEPNIYLELFKWYIKLGEKTRTTRPTIMKTEEKECE